MKKLLSIALVLVFALSLAAPALAYTDVTDSGTNPYVADIYLVDYSNVLALFGGVSLSLPATNRAYGVNEVVAAVASFTIPATANILDAYGEVVFKVNNISFNVADNKVIGSNANLTNDYKAATPTSLVFALNSDNDKITYSLSTASNVIAANSSKAVKHSVLLFGKVLDDDAEMSIELSRGAAFESLALGLATRLQANFNATITSTVINLFATAYNVADPLNEYVVLSDDYVVYTNGSNGEKRVYAVSDNPKNEASVKALLVIEVSAKDVTEGVLYKDGNIWYRFFMTPGGDIVINDTSSTQLARVETGSAKYNSLLSGFTTLFEDLGLTLTNRTNIMKSAFWTGIANSSNIKETVSIDPLALPYIQVPEVEVTEPPKTGSAASILGFVIIAMAGVAAVVVRKVRA